MPAYSYKAIDNQGKNKKGIVEAVSIKAARTQLRNESLIPLEVTEVNKSNKGFNLNTTIWESKIFNSSELTVFTQQLASLVGAGLSIERALSSLIEDANKRQFTLLSDVRADINAGSSFAKALSKYPREFSNNYRAVIEAGEQSGFLAQVLEQLAQDLEQQQTLKAKITGAAIYPAIVMGLAIVIIIGLMTFVVPTIAQVFSQSKQSLPGITMAVMAISDFIRHYWLYLLAIIIIGVVSFKLLLRNPSNRLKFDALCLRLPILGNLSKGYNSAKFASTLAMLTNAGIPILKALSSAADTLSNQAMRNASLDALVQVREGAPLSMALSSKNIFPSILPMFIRLGEQSGNLPLMLQRVALQISTNVQRRAIALATILEPILIIFTALIVIIIVLAILLPIINLNQMI